MRLRLLCSTLASIMLVGIVTGHASADEITVTIQGRSNPVPGQGVKDAPNKIRVWSFDRELISPRDAASGQATGKRQHKPITFTMDQGAASPSLFHALVTNEVLPSVVFEFAHSTKQHDVFYTIKLTNVFISGLRAFTAPPPDRNPSAGDIVELEAVTLSFEKIEVQSADSKTVAEDDSLQSQ